LVGRARGGGGGTEEGAEYYGGGVVGERGGHFATMCRREIDMSAEVWARERGGQRVWRMGGGE